MPNLTDPTVQVRRARVLELKLRGLSNRTIGPMLEPPVSYETVRKDLNAVLDELAEETHDNAERLRAVELARLDNAMRVCLEILNGEEQEPSVRLTAAEKVSKLVERKAKLVGLDAPERHEVSGDGALTPAAVAAATREVFRNELGASSGTGPEAQSVPASVDR